MFKVFQKIKGIIKFYYISFSYFTTNDNWIEYVKLFKLAMVYCLKKLVKKQNLIHAHGNNYSPFINSITSFLELTYIKKNQFETAPHPISSLFPTSSLNYPNVPGRQGIVLGKFSLYLVE